MHGLNYFLQSHFRYEIGRNIVDIDINYFAKIFDVTWEGRKLIFYLCVIIKVIIVYDLQKNY